MKWIAGCMIIICSLLIGKTCRERLCRRVKFLDDMLVFSRNMFSRISYSSLPPDKLIENASGQFFRLCRFYTGPEGDVRGGWTKAMENCEDVGLLSEEEKDFIRKIGYTLGLYDEEQQLMISQGNIKELERMSEKATEQLNEKGKMYITCSLLLGMLTAILII